MDGVTEGILDSLDRMGFLLSYGTHYLSNSCDVWIDYFCADGTFRSAHGSAPTTNLDDAAEAAIESLMRRINNRNVAAAAEVR